MGTNLHENRVDSARSIILLLDSARKPIVASVCVRACVRGRFPHLRVSASVHRRKTAAIVGRPLLLFGFRKYRG